MGETGFNPQTVQTITKLALEKINVQIDDLSEADLKQYGYIVYNIGVTNPKDNSSFKNLVLTIATVGKATIDWFDFYYPHTTLQLPPGTTSMSRLIGDFPQGDSVNLAAVVNYSNSGTIDPLIAYVTGELVPPPVTILAKPFRKKTIERFPNQKLASL